MCVCVEGGGGGWGGWGGGRAHIVSPLSVLSIHPVRKTNGLCAISFDKIGVLN